MNMVFQAVVIILAIVVFVVLTVKGLGTIPSAIVAAAIVSLIAIDGFTANLFGTFLDGMSSMFSGFFIPFSCGMAFGGVLSACGAADRLGVSIVKAFGQKNFIYAIILVTFLFGLTGAPPLAMMPALCFGMLKSANLPRYIGMAAVAGATSIATTCMPGTLGAGNVIASNMLGTTVYAGAGLGIATSVFGLIILCIYINRLIDKTRRDNIGYDATEGGIMAGGVRDENDMPSFVCALIPVLVVLLGCAVCVLGLKLSSAAAVLFSTVAGIILLVVLNYKYFKGNNILGIISKSVISIQWTIVAAIAVCGFASVVSNTEFFQAAVGQLTGSTFNPYLLIVVGVIITSALCASCISGVAAFIRVIGGGLVAMGVSPDIIHRLANITSGTFDSMPHGGSIILALTSFGYNHKQGYKYLVHTTLVIPVIYTAFALIVSLIFY